MGLSGWSSEHGGESVAYDGCGENTGWGFGGIERGTVVKNRCGCCGSRNTHWNFFQGRECSDCGYVFKPERNAFCIPQEWKMVCDVGGDFYDGDWHEIPDGCLMIAREDSE